MRKLLLNCDMGESFGAWRMGLDEEVMPHIDCANIACGYHASDPGIMRRTALLALEHGVRIGAHPSYPDLMGFGRRSMKCSAQEIRDMLLYQIGALDGICRAEGGRVSYMKPHGALYNDMMQQPDVLRAVMQAASDYDPALPLVVLAQQDNSAVRSMAAEFGLELIFEAFADRAYDASGQLVPRDQSGAVHQSTALILQQSLILARGEPLRASDGSSLMLAADTLCVHGDNAESVAVVRQIAAALDAASRI